MRGATHGPSLFCTGHGLSLFAFVLIPTSREPAGWRVLCLQIRFTLMDVCTPLIARCIVQKGRREHADSGYTDFPIRN